MNIAKHLKHNYTLIRSYKEIGAFGGTGEPCIFLDRDAWDRGLVVPAYSLHIFKKIFAASFFRKMLISAKGKRPKSAD